MDPIVRTGCGEIRGSSAEGIHVFKGIPYAAPPFGKDRLLPPRPARAWTGVRDALTFGAEPPQLRHPQVEAFLPDPTVPGEDCLNLNIWSPALGPPQRPVMVWIPGGSFELGTGATYDGSRFARDGVVFVSINYRVGVEGFLYLGEGCANLGLLDQIAALDWVRENIAAFGGDPANVTVFGESAGAMSIGTLLAMPRAEGLFRRAIVQSGAAHHVISPTTARRMAQRLADKLGVPATREAIAPLPFQRVLQAHTELHADLQANPDPELWGGEVVTSSMLWQPVIDGELIPARPIALIAEGAGSDVDLMVGTNIDDWRLFVVLSGALDKATDESLARAVAQYGLPLESTLAHYRAAHASAGDLLAAIQTDWWCRIPAIRLADAHAEKSSATFMYEFAWRSPAWNGLFGACHGLEIPFVFDTLAASDMRVAGPLLGPAPPQQLADAMHTAWVAFATHGHCGWPRYDLGRRATMRFNTSSQVVDDPRSAERALWKGVR